MGLFDKLKSIINKKENIEIKDENVQKYDEGLEKSRNEFVSKLSMLGIKYTKINDEYFDELENILIMADIGINTVMDFMDRLKGLVEENTTSDNNTIHYENTDIIQLDTGEIVLYSEDEQDNIDSQEE